MQTTRIDYTHPDPRRAATTRRLANAEPQRRVVRLTAANPTTVIRTGR